MNNMKQVKEKAPSAPRWWWGHPGFYDYPIENGIEISDAYRDELIMGQENGYEIVENETGYPVLAEPGPKTLDEWRTAKLDEITAFDGSDQVNRFYVGKVATWFDKGTRGGLRDTLDAEEQAGKMNTTLWVGSEPARPVDLAISDARKMLNDVEVYSKEVFNVTQRHCAAVYALESADEIKAYDHTSGYPEQLSFATK